MNTLYKTLFLLIGTLGLISNAYAHRYDYYLEENQLTTNHPYPLNEPYLNGQNGVYSTDFVYNDDNTAVGFKIIDQIGQNLYGSYSLTIVANIIVLDVNGNQLSSVNHTFNVDYDPAGQNNYTFHDFYQHDGAHGYEVEILSWNDHGAGFSSIPSNVHVYATFSYDRFIDFNPSISSYTQWSNPVVGLPNRYFELNWITREDAEYYDLEYSWVYDENEDGIISSEDFDFKANATRVRIDDTLCSNVDTLSYRLPFTFETGWLVWRIRAVGKKMYSSMPATYYSPWSVSQSGNLSSLTDGINREPITVNGNNMNLSIVMENDINWHHSVQFAENGKRIDQVQFSDATGRVRQSVQSANIDPLHEDTLERILVTEMYYDDFGREAVVTLPAPDQVTSNHRGLYFRDGFNRKELNTSQVFSHNDFQGNGLDCSPDVKAMSDLFGTAAYYSSNNVITSTATYNPHNYVPSAAGFPFTHKLYTSDQTGRVKQIGAPGEHLNAATDHSTQFFYGIPSQEELDVLFGNFIGSKEFYRKKVTIDPNGQIAVEYVDLQGNIIATSLAGESPDNTEALASANSGQNLTVSLLPPSQDPLPWETIMSGELTYTQSILVETSGDSDFNYDFVRQNFSVKCPSEALPDCHTCAYDLTIRIYNSCGDVIEERVVDVPNQSQCTTSVYTLSQFTVYLEPGSYGIEKILSVDKDQLRALAEEYAQCKRDSVFDVISTDYLSQIDYTSCDPQPYLDACSENQGQVFVQDEYEYLQTYNIHQSLLHCPYIDPCFVARVRMINDLMPGGQYGSHSGDLEAGSFYNSVTVTNGVQFVWNNPPQPYENADGSPAVVEVVPAYPTGYIPAVVNDNLVSYDALTDTYSTPPDNLLNVADFVNLVNDDWIASVIDAHPEWSCYQDCIENDRTFYLYGSYMGTLTFDQAVNEGIIGTNGVFTSGLGFDLGLPVVGDIPAFEAIIDDLYPCPGSSDLTIEEVAYMLTNNIDPSNWCTTTVNIDNCEKDRYWQVLQKLYRGLRANYFEDTYSSSQTCSLIVDKESVFLPGSQTILVDELDPDPVNATTADQLATDQCITQCQERASRWMVLLEECWNNPPSNATEQSLKNALSLFCEDHCDFTNILNTPDGLLQIRNIIAGYDIDMLCVDTLLTAIYPQQGLGFDAVQSDAVAPPDSCSCNLVNAVRDEIIALGQPQLPYQSREIMAKYGMTPDLYSELTCKCDQAGSPGSWNVSMITNLFSNDEILLPRSMTCEECMPCDTIGHYYNVYSQVLSSQLDTFQLFELMRPHLNELYFSEWSAYELYSFFNACYDVRSCFNRDCEGLNTYIDLLNELFSGLGCDVQEFNSLDPVMGPYSMLHDLLGTSHDYTNDWLHIDAYVSNGVWRVDFIFYDTDHMINEWCRLSFETQVPATSTFKLFPLCLNEVFIYQPEMDCDLFIENIQVIVDGQPQNISLFNGLSDCFASACESYSVLYPNETDSVLCASSPFDGIDPCRDFLEQDALAQAEIVTEQIVEEIEQELYDNFLEACMTGLNENFRRDSRYEMYHHTLYYYDRAGNLVQTVSPKGVQPLSNAQVQQSMDYRISGTGSAQFPTHGMKTEYFYDSYNQLTSQNTPDAGFSQFYYDELGQLVASQRAKQALTNDYSYSMYDDLGRVYEAGELSPGSGIGNNDKDRLKFLAWVNGGTRSEVTRTWYDESVSSFINGEFPDGQLNLRNRVATTAYFDSYDPLSDQYDDAQSLAHYSYDVHGNVTDYLVQIPELYDVEEFYLMEYDFDLLSGKVNQVDYQRNKGLDSWSHRYHYDANFRITEVETSRDGLHWESQARYSYYIHGPLMRTELGQERVQGLDYAYTINGWLVGVNGINVNQATSDMGRDGSNTGPHKRVARDAFGFALAYFENSYTPIKTGLTHSMKLASLNAATNHRDMYNGNISGMSTSMLDESEVGVVTHYHRYRYDQLNRIMSSRIGNLFSSDGALPGTYADQASTTYSYDANGNILTLDRYDLNGAQFDDFTYHYGTANNRLGHVSDAILSSAYANDLENGQSSGNYSYDADGNLISDVQEGINSITWNVQGKVSKIDKAAGPDLEFRYDPMGQRQMKIVKNGTLEPNWIKNYYIRDPQGNVMAVYKMNYNPIQISANQYEREYWVDEHHIYGSSRHGVRHTQERIQYREIEVGGYDSNGNIEGYGAMSTTNYTSLPTKAIRGITNYELTNHLGNVMSTISDRKVPVDDVNNNILYFLPDVDTYQDYFPFGMVMSERSGSESSAEYRFGFNGMEYENELYQPGNAYDFGARVYDGRIGRWFSVDPYRAKYPDLTPYAFSGNSPLFIIDPNGKELWIAGNIEQAKKDLYALAGGKEQFEKYFEVTDDNQVIQKVTIEQQVITSDGQEVIGVDPGVDVISKLVTMVDPETNEPLMFKYEAYNEFDHENNETIPHERTGYKTGKRMGKQWSRTLAQEGGIMNMSVTPFDPEGYLASKTKKTPNSIAPSDPDYTGHVVIGDVSGLKNIKTGNSKSRESVVFHEMWEMYYRGKGMPYESKDEKNSAHQMAIAKEKLLSKSDVRRDVGSEGEADAD